MKNEVIKSKLKPMEQWFCDCCGEIIEHKDDGMLEWKSNLTENKDGFYCTDFRIVHGNWIKGCTKQRYDNIDLSDGHLDWFLGNDGLNRLLAFLFEKQLNPKELAIIIKRLHQKYFEEARVYIPIAHSENHNEIDPYNIGDLNERDAIWLIRKYAKEY